MSKIKHIPMTLKLIYTAFVAVMVSVYWHDYGPQNFLYFCDVAVLVTLVGIWIESPLLISMEAVAILLPQMLWIIDFLTHLCGFRLLGMTDYMFDARHSLFLRGISLFHGWLPMLLVWLILQLGYDRRALRIQTVVCSALLLVCYFAFVPPGGGRSGAMVVNINYVFGMSESLAQTRMPPLLWLGMLIFGIPVLFYVPTHLLLQKLNRLHVKRLQADSKPLL